MCSQSSSHGWQCEIGHTSRRDAVWIVKGVEQLSCVSPSQSSRTWLLLQWLVGYMYIARFQTSHWFFYRDHQRNIHCYIFLWFQLCQGLFRVNVIWIQTGWNNCSDLLLEKFINADIFRDFNWNNSCYCKLNVLKKAVSNSVAAL